MQSLECLVLLKSPVNAMYTSPTPVQSRILAYALQVCIADKSKWHSMTDTMTRRHCQPHFSSSWRSDPSL